MVQTHTIKVYNRQTGTSHTLEVPEDRYILHTAEHNGTELPFSCRNGACTTCAVRVLFTSPRLRFIMCKLRSF